MLILRDPAPDSSGGGTVVPTPQPAPVPVPTTAPAPPPTPQPEPPRIAVAIEDYQRFLEAEKKLADIDIENKRALDAKENERLKTLAEKGEVERALTELRDKKDVEIRKATERADSLEAQILNSHRESVIAGGMLGTEFISEAAAKHARVVLEPRFESVRDATGNVVVRDKATHKPASEVIKEWLASDESAHFRKASTQGGAGAKGADMRSATNPDKPVATVNTVDELIAMAQKQNSQRDESYYGLARGVH